MYIYQALEYKYFCIMPKIDSQITDSVQVNYVIVLFCLSSIEAICLVLLGFNLETPNVLCR